MQSLFIRTNKKQSDSVLDFLSRTKTQEIQIQDNKTLLFRPLALITRKNKISSTHILKL